MDKVGRIQKFRERLEKKEAPRLPKKKKTQKTSAVETKQQGSTRVTKKRAKK